MNAFRCKTSTFLLFLLFSLIFFVLSSFSSFPSVSICSQWLCSNKFKNLTQWENYFWRRADLTLEKDAAGNTQGTNHTGARVTSLLRPSAGSRFSGAKAGGALRPPRHLPGGPACLPPLPHPVCLHPSELSSRCCLSLRGHGTPGSNLENPNPQLPGQLVRKMVRVGGWGPGTGRLKASLAKQEPATH